MAYLELLVLGETERGKESAQSNIKIYILQNINMREKDLHGWN
jgi:hypothetical protein